MLIMIKLKVKTRDNKSNPKKLRRENLIPAIVYGQEKEGKNIAANYINFEKVYEEAGESSLVELEIDDKDSKKVLIHDVQIDSVSGKFLHVDFYEVDLTKKVTAPVELEFVGEAPIVKNEGGILIKHLNEIEIECLPTNLIKKFKVDISGLTDFDSAIHVKDLQISDKINILDDLEEVVVNISEPKEEEEPEPAPAEGEEKEDGEKTEEGEKVEGEEKKEGGEVKDVEQTKEGGKQKKEDSK